MGDPLLPCRDHPDAPAVLSANVVRGDWEVRCSRCPSFVWGDTPEEATRDWNRAQERLRREKPELGATVYVVVQEDLIRRVCSTEGAAIDLARAIFRDNITAEDPADEEIREWTSKDLTAGQHRMGWVYFALYDAEEGNGVRVERHVIDANSG